ncbi:MAG: 2-methylfumaryl-CoA isomerase [Gammaproteobacteria bacterium]|nr:2-methylfumaryl-CoA isomerase [Gammaproteobacteria bacterium]
MQDILKGIRIVEGSAFIAAPSAGMTLAQLGADVIRFDMIGGGIDYHRWPVSAKGKSLYWHSLNKGKRSIAVDFRHAEGRELLVQLITAPGEDAGLFVTNFPARGWLGDEMLRAHREDLIFINLAGDRHGGNALDYTVNSKVGLPYLIGDGEEPKNNPFPAWDVIAGQQIALGLLAAERHRRRTGSGQFVSITLADVALATMGHLGYIAEAQINEMARQPVGNHIFGTFGHDFLCQDGKRVMVVGVSTKQWQALVNVTETEAAVAALEEQLGLSFVQEGDRFEARESLRGIFEPWFLSKRFSTVAEALNSADACWGPYQNIAELVADDIDCSEDNPLFQSVNQPGIGECLMPGQALSFGAFIREAITPAPLLGQHTDEVLSEILGLSDMQIGRLHDKKIVEGPDERN